MTNVPDDLEMQLRIIKGDLQYLAEEINKLKAEKNVEESTTSKEQTEFTSLQYTSGYSDGFLKAKELYERPKANWELEGMIWYCSNCGQYCEQGGNKFCGQCGAEMVGED